MGLLRDSTYGLIAEAESRGGIAVQVRTDTQLSVLAAIRYSRMAGMPHEILLSPKGESTADYLVTSQCGILLRTLDLPAADRRLLGSNPRAAKTVEKLLIDSGFGRLPPAQLATIRDQLYAGLLTQLRSMPIGMRVDTWIYADMPYLREQQRASMLQQLRDNTAALSPSVIQQFPAGVVDRTAAMSIAFAQFWTELAGDPEHVQPYLRRPQLARGMALLTSARETPDDAAHDYALINAWAQTLDMTGWYTWIPYAQGT